mmetsp:Transcript_73071/g.211505  ORF Transcript_73071/g.211505 Transcript_73071/m.211505 type:complete len:216 (+) Transcript_73071:1786-2433(+)
MGAEVLGFRLCLHKQPLEVVGGILPPVGRLQHGCDPSTQTDGPERVQLGRLRLSLLDQGDERAGVGGMVGLREDADGTVMQVVLRKEARCRIGGWSNVARSWHEQQEHVIPAASSIGPHLAIDDVRDLCGLVGRHCGEPRQVDEVDVWYEGAMDLDDEDAVGEDAGPRVRGRGLRELAYLVLDPEPGILLRHALGLADGLLGAVVRNLMDAERGP